MKQSNKKPPRLQKNSRYYQILEEVTAGDRLIGFLTSARSTRRMHRTTYSLARERFDNKRALERLEGCGYVKRGTRDGAVVFFATADGKRALHQLYGETANLQRNPKRWDGSWHIVAYDFPENKRSYRNSLRHVLGKTGFLQIQKSVWIFPYTAPLLESLLERDQTIRNHTLFMEIKKISADFDYRKHFGLLK